MTHEEAIARCAELNGSGERRWFVTRAGTDEWHVVSVPTPERGELHESSESRPVDAPDPRPSLLRNIPPYGPAGL